MIARRTILVAVVVLATVFAFGVGSVAASPVTAVTINHGTSVPTGSDSLATAAKSTSLAPSDASRLALQQKALAIAKSDHLSTEALGLPNFLSQAHLQNDVVMPGYPTSPAPMGLATYGVMNTTGTAVPYTIQTDSWEGTLTINSQNTFLLDNDGALSTNGAENTFGVQLNAVTTDTTLLQASTYSFWTQNVLYFNFPYPGTVTFLDNVWNFSSPAVSLTSGTIYSGNGTPVYPEFYYDFGPTFTYTLPLTVHLYLNSSTTDIAGIGYSTVRFGFSLVDASTGITEASGVYDTVLFTSTTPAGSVPDSPFLVDGSQVTPTGFIPFDAEIMIGGPGGGTTTSVYGFSGTASLQYWDATAMAYENPSDAWNVASETGETVEGLDVTYTTPGTVDLSAGPSIPMPLWGATPGGNAGEVTVSGPLSPSNAFVFFTPGPMFDANFAGWAPTQTASSISFLVAPGQYTVDAMLSDYTPKEVTFSASAGQHVVVHFDLHHNYATGVYTPLMAWNNAQLAAISYGGDGSAWHPYLIVNNPAPGGLNPVFGQYNDYVYYVFAGVLFAGTTAHVDLNNPSLFAVTYDPAFAYAGILGAYGLPYTNNLQFELFDTSNVSIWHAQGITGWFFFEDYGPTGFLPLANVVVWGGTHNLIGDSTFVSQGSSLLLAGVDPTAPTGNVVWGNTFVNSTELTPTMYPGDGVANGPPIAIFAFEGGDLIYNNWIGTSITAFAPDANMFTGGGQLNVENWNLPQIEPRGYTMWFNGYPLSGTIVPSKWQGGNFWTDYVPGVTALPYNEYGFIAEGGDYLPLPLSAYSVVFTLTPSYRGFGFGGVEWSVTLNGNTETTHGNSLVFYETPGTYSYSVTLVHGMGSITPSSGTVDVTHHNVQVHLYYHR